MSIFARRFLPLVSKRRLPAAIRPLREREPRQNGKGGSSLYPEMERS